ncbi:MAG: sugar transferase [Gemmatimonadota bacterium]|nr:MAG: sugar transferase [Gemmatimonadota bacterium]
METWASGSQSAALGAASAAAREAGEAGAKLVAVGGGDLPILQLRVPPYGFGARALNVMIATAAFFALAPVIAFIAWAIKLSSPGPAFYMQDRIGMDRRNGSAGSRAAERRARDLGGRPFRMYKFRTMRVGAERETGPVWAKPGDNRVTPLGRLLRRTRLDELPQLWNVVRGDMNIVGPRPERPTLVAYLSQEVDGYTLRHRVRPGITGWAQVHQAYDTTLQSVRCKLMYDLDYIERRSVIFDLGVMLKTIPAIFRKRGGW